MSPEAWVFIPLIVVWTGVIVLTLWLTRPKPFDLMPLHDKIRFLQAEIIGAGGADLVLHARADKADVATKALETRVDTLSHSLAAQGARLAARIDATQAHADAAHRSALEAVELATPAHVGDTHQHRLAKVATETRDGLTWDLYRCTDPACDKRVFFSA